MTASSPRRPLLRIVYYQAVIAFLACLLVKVFLGSTAARAVFAAGTIVVAANWVFVTILFRCRGKCASRRLVASFYLGEILKLALTAVLLAVAISVCSVAPLPLLITYFILQIILWPMGMMEVSKGFL